MSAALFWSGGKDSLLALGGAQRNGLPVTHLVNIHDAESGRVRFHGVRKELIAEQAARLGKTLVQRATTPQAFEQAFTALLQDLRRAGITDIVFGNIQLADVRAWYEERTTAHGLSHHEPLWGCAPRDLLQEFVTRGHRARITSVYLQHGGREAWLGREFTAHFVQELIASPDIDACGERGEYHSFCFGGPLFASEIEVHAASRFLSEGHLISDLELARERAGAAVRP